MNNVQMQIALDYLEKDMIEIRNNNLTGIIDKFTSLPFESKISVLEILNLKVVHDTFSEKGERRQKKGNAKIIEFNGHH